MPIHTPSIEDTLTPFAKSLINSLVGHVGPKDALKSTFTVVDPGVEAEEATKKRRNRKQSLVKSLADMYDTPETAIQRLAFEEDPTAGRRYHGLYKQKERLIPDAVLKRISIQDDLVATILNARANQLSTFGRPQEDRFSIGFVIEPKAGVLEDIKDDEEKKRFNDEIDEAVELFKTCGHTKGLAKSELMSFSNYLKVSTKNVCGLGRIATEMIRADDPVTGKSVFHRFRPIDVGTIYEATCRPGAADGIRQQAAVLLAELRNERIEPQRFAQGDYAWMQVIDGQPKQAFTEEECLVHNFYPVNDIELGGYPVTPIDTVIAAVTTHINITTHNKLYFQSGRAARGMLVLKSDEMDENVISRIRQQFNASINSVGNAFRMPVFGISSTDEISFASIDSGTRDMEFQYLSDTNARVILSAFQMSPEELPGYSHLSRGTNSQALCIDLGTRIVTSNGNKTLEVLLGDKSECYTKVWTGKAWAEARVFRSGPKCLSVTELNNGSVIKSSPDHRFRVLTGDGPAWKRQQDLAIGDHVLVNAKPVRGAGAIPEYEGRPLTAEMMEILGWLTGDGNVSVRFNKNTGNQKQGVLSWFYNHETELGVWDRHFKTLEEFGLAPKHCRLEYTPERQAKMLARYGKETDADAVYSNRLYDSGFVKWLLALGFTRSRRAVNAKPGDTGKTIPAFIHTLPVEFRQAFLRGMFSSDGGRGSTRGAPRIVIHDHILRAQCHDLLLGMGLRTQLSQGIRRARGRLDVRDQGERVFVDESATLVVKDKDLFYERVGYVKEHTHKTLVEGDLNDCCVWDKVPPALFHSAGRACLASGLLCEHSKKLLHTAMSPSHEPQWGYSKRNMLDYMEEAGVSVPAWLTDFHSEPVVSLETTEQTVEMGDVEIFDDEHAFVANGVVVHNSESNSEYILIAHRDVGIRPLIAQWEDFINTSLFPVLAPKLAKKCVLRLVGLSAETAEKESIRLQQDAPVHMTYDEILDKVEKDPVGHEWGGDFPLNPAYQTTLDKYFTVGALRERFFGIPNKDPAFAYVRDPFWFQFQQMQMQAQQMQQQAQAQQQQAQAQQSGGGGGAPSGGGGGSAPSGGGAETSAQSADAQSAQADNQVSAANAGQDLSSGADQAAAALTKGEAQLPPSKKRVLGQHKAIVKHFMDGWLEDSGKAIQAILNEAKAQNRRIK